MNLDRARGQQGGLLRVQKSESGERSWRHFAPYNAPHSVYGIGESSDGTLWVGGFWGVRALNFKGTAPAVPSELAGAACEIIYSTANGELWVGTRTRGAFRFDGQSWTQHDSRTGLDDSHVRSMLKTSTGQVWLATRSGLHGWDGRTWLK